MSKIRVLFVDDEPLVLQGLQRMFRPMRNEWEMAFVESGAAALQRLAEVPFQVIVTDMRMPAMNGAQLLSQVQQLYPKMVRLILSGHADKELILKCVGTAHQFLAKPCELEALRAAITRGCQYDSLLRDERIKQLIARMDCLPSVPALLNEVAEHLGKDDCNIDEVARIISKDLGMTAKLLKLVNSSFFGLRRRVSSPDEAVSYLGLATIRSLVLAVNAFAPFDGHGHGPISFESLWSHSLEVAGLARQIAGLEGAAPREEAEAFIAGMLHDVGKLALSANVPDEYAAVLRSSREGRSPLFETEAAAFGADHGAIGGYLLNLWGLPESVVSGIFFHHNPAQAGPSTPVTVLAVHAANAVAHHRNNAAGVDQSFIASAGLWARFEEWKQLNP